MRYEIQGETLPVVIMELEDGEGIITQGGGMSWMTPNLVMETVGGGIGKVFGRMLSADTMFQNIYTAQDGDGMIACAAKFPGSIKVFEITPDNPMILQKSAFLCSEMGVDFSIFFQKKIGAGLFGGEGFILQKISGEGLCFAEFNGHLLEYELGPGEELIVETGNLAAMTASCEMDIVTVKGIKNKFLGGEGFFNTKITGPGTVWVQSMSPQEMALALAKYLPSQGS